MSYARAKSEDAHVNRFLKSQIQTLRDSPLQRDLFLEFAHKNGVDLMKFPARLYHVLYRDRAPSAFIAVLIIQYFKNKNT